MSIQIFVQDHHGLPECSYCTFRGCKQQKAEAEEAEAAQLRKAFLTRMIKNIQEECSKPLKDMSLDEIEDCNKPGSRIARRGY